jgi:hypothetical protein
MKHYIVALITWYFVFQGSTNQPPRIFGPFDSKARCEYARAQLANVTECWEWK